MEILARGDFNGDGAEDLLLRNSEWLGYAYASRSQTFLVTRHQRQSVLRVLPLTWEGGA